MNGLTCVPSDSLSRLAQIEDWLDQQRKASGFSCTRINFSEALRWVSDPYVCRHESGGFFSIAAIASDCASLPAQPIILQPEVGILGFLLREQAGELELLFQAKTEPGNVGAIQLAPSVQATRSNYLRLHGGKATRFLDFFLQPEIHGAVVLADSLQSEQGTRFRDKFNRNMMVMIKGPGPELADDHWRWVPLRLLPELIRQDFWVNTDARSVLACGMTALLSKPPAMASPSRLHAAITQLLTFRIRQQFKTRLVAFSELAWWRVGEEGIVDQTRKGMDVTMWRVCALDREVTHWDQPLVESLQQGRNILFCQRRQEEWSFLLQASVEIGFSNGVEYGPSVQWYPGKQENDVVAQLLWQLASSGVVRARCLQSDEGGRFYHSVSSYEMIELDRHTELPEDERLCWLSLAELVLLLEQQGMANNELRSCLALWYACPS